MATISERAAAAISAVEQGAAPDNPLALRLMRMVAHVAGAHCATNDLLMISG